ncbi:quinone oxidoreductase family protein [Futiania mangrovi]|uniref:Zinc-binding dehydrogenase n=1 Tax=Futiania mangrovi TaxID=2959716 RepID=A0A9J6PNN7_9PROT|nr:zinc-binding dehydrogenase [Futiania mangrovii]MCP1337690.1 zinc-binding dehydrogenase [Futiania mangrovii]
MRAALIVETNGTKALSVQDIPDPAPSAGQLLVRVKAAGLNRADLALNANHRQVGAGQSYPIAGLEFAGEVVAAGDGVERWTPGDRVMGMTAGAYAGYCVIDQRHAMPVPAGVDWRTAATLPVALQTMYDAIVTNGGLRSGESVLVQGAASGVGIVGMQIAKLMGASVVIGASRSDEKLAALKAHGMDEGVNTTDPNWPERVRTLTGGKGVDLVIDMVSGETVNGSMLAAAILGRIVNVGRLGGMSGPFEFDLHALKRLSYIGVTFRTRSDVEIAAIVAATAEALQHHVEAGRIALPVVAAFPLEDITSAYDLMRTNTHLGKIVIEP